MTESVHIILALQCGERKRAELTADRPGDKAISKSGVGAVR